MKMRMRTFAAGLALGVAWVAAVAVRADAQSSVAAAQPAVAFTDSTPALLAGTKRVAITNVVISFQASTGDMKGGGLRLPIVGSKETVQNVLAMPEMDPALQAAIAEAAYKNLANQLKKAGYEVVPEAQVKASASYQGIIKQAGYANNSKFANSLGDVFLVGPQSLPPYTAYQGETGNFVYPSTTYMAWTSGFGGKSVTPGGLSIMQQSNAWKVPGLEVALAKELNAHVVKAYYVVSLGKTSVKRKVGYETVTGEVVTPYGNRTDTRQVKTTGGTSSSYAQAALIPDQTHIAFRSPTGNAKWQKVAMAKIVPPKDGDVVVRITDPVMGGTDWFSIQAGEWQRAGGLFSAQKRADINGLDLVTLTDPQGYAQDVVQMMWLANAAMLGLVPAQ